MEETPTKSWEQIPVLTSEEIEEIQNDTDLERGIRVPLEGREMPARGFRGISRLKIGTGWLLLGAFVAGMGLATFIASCRAPRER